MQFLYAHMTRFRAKIAFWGSENLNLIFVLCFSKIKKNVAYAKNKKKQINKQLFKLSYLQLCIK